LSDRSIEWANVPSVCRRIVVLVVVACLPIVGVGGLATAALGQGAGDQQYQDPFDDSSGGSTTTQQSQPTQTTPSDDLEPLSPSPQDSGTGSSGSGSTSPSTANEPAPAAAAQGLPNTGADTRLLLAAGAALLLTGLGLRLRSTPERF
jgi:LPXTG-motif cell wall-anchored protein